MAKEFFTIEEQKFFDSLGLHEYNASCGVRRSFRIQSGALATLSDFEKDNVDNYKNSDWKRAQFIFVDARDTTDTSNIDLAVKGCKKIIEKWDNEYPEIAKLFIFKCGNGEYKLYSKNTGDAVPFDLENLRGMVDSILDDNEIEYSRLSSEEKLSLLKKFIRECTKSPGCENNYTDFKRINECINAVLGSQGKTILDFNTSKEVENIRNSLLKNPLFIEYDKKGNKQYSNSLSNYINFLNARNMFSRIVISEKTSCKPVIFCNMIGQKIFFGAPGTGKSHKIDNGLFKNEDVSAYGLMSVSQDCKFRTTFHPDYDYTQFVGSYKPKKDTNGNITYSFVPQVFAKAYAAAWKAYLENQTEPKPVYLVIEEINRGNCAQIFGDLFQLLDRKNGESEYPINADADFGQWLVDEAKIPGHEYDENGCVKIKLPPNFNILATMNTSDQSLFPMDSAFKRRFDWEYVPIQYKNPYNAEKEKDAHDKWLADKFVIDLGLKENNPKWLHFLKKVNADIYKVTQSEDKQMGEFFVKPKDGVIDLNMFRSKVLFYLWDSVYKDEVDHKTTFHFNYPEKNGSEVTFQSLFGEDATAIEIIKQMMDNLDKAYESKDGSEFKDFKILT